MVRIVIRVGSGHRSGSFSHAQQKQIGSYDLEDTILNNSLQTKVQHEMFKFGIANLIRVLICLFLVR